MKNKKKKFTVKELVELTVKIESVQYDENKFIIFEQVKLSYNDKI